MPKRAPIASEEEAHDEAVRMLARKARSAAEVASALEAKGVTRDTIDSVVARLKSQRHLDDAELAEDQAFALVEGKGCAPAMAVSELVARGVEERLAREAVEAAREGRSELELCARALEKRTGGKAIDSARAAKEGRALARLGYEEEVVLRALEKAASRSE